MVLCKMSPVRLYSAWEDGAVFGWGILESAKIGRNLGNIKSEKREKPQPIGFSLKLVFKDQPMLKLFLVHLLNPLAFLL